LKIHSKQTFSAQKYHFLSVY